MYMDDMLVSNHPLQGMLNFTPTALKGIHEVDTRSKCILFAAPW